MGAYYSFATAFGFTPAQVDEIDLVTLESLFIIGKADAEEQERKMKNARR